MVVTKLPSRIPVSDVNYEYQRLNEDVFRSRNIQMADAVRLRAMRTARLRRGHDVDPRACLFIRSDIPKLESLMAAWSQPIRRINPVTGKWELDKRGGDEAAKSPDPFDGLCLSFAADSEYGLRAR